MKYTVPFLVVPFVIVLMAFTQAPSDDKMSRDWPQLIPDSTERPADFVSIFDTMAIGEIMTIGWRSEGCFGFTYDSLIVRRIKTGFWVRHDRIEKTLAPSEMNALRDFDYGVHRIELQDDGCTTTEYYTYKRAGDSFVAAEDGTCRWGGFDALLSALHL